LEVKSATPFNYTSATDYKMAVRQDNVLALALSRFVDFLNQIRYFLINEQSNFPYEVGWNQFQTLSPFKFVEMLGFKPATSWFVIRHADPSANEAVYNNNNSMAYESQRFNAAFTRALQ
jgi:hypothetical protein